MNREKLSQITSTQEGFIHQGRVIVRGTDKRQMLRARVVMQEYLGRKLQPGEVVHHINGDTLDDRVENLAVMSHGDHMRLHHLGNKYALGRKLSPEHRAAISYANRTRKRGSLSAEHKASISAGMKRAWRERKRKEAAA